MDSFNKVISFILGLVVVLVFIIVFTGKINYKGKPLFVFGKPTGGLLSQFVKTTPTPSPTIQPDKNKVIKTINIDISKEPTLAPATYGRYTSSTNNNAPIKKIPATGSPTILLPLLLTSFFIGRKLQQKK